MILFSGIVFGQRIDNRLDVKFKADNEDMISVKLNKIFDDQVRIQVYNWDKSKIIHDELINDTEYFKKVFDFSKMTGYAYFVTVSNEAYNYERKVALAGNEWSIENFDVMITERESSKVEVRLTENSESVEQIRIMNSTGEPVYESADISELSAYQFDLSHLPKGTYRFEISGNGLSVSKTVKRS